MPQLKDLHPRPSSRSSTGRSAAPVKQYPRRPFPTIAALLIDPTARTIRTVYLRPTPTGLRSIFGDTRVTFTDKPGLRAYGTKQHEDDITHRATLPNARVSVQGKVLVTGPEFTEVYPEIASQILKETIFSYSDAFEADRFRLGYSSGNFSK